MSSLKTLVIIPTYNEKHNIEKLIQEIFSFASDVSILVVDDNSPDGTALVVQSYIKQHPNIYLLQRPAKEGLGLAYRAGFDWALERDFSKIIQMDADFSHPPRYLPEMINQLKNFDVVIGSRYIAGGQIENWGLFRKLLSQGGSLYARWMLNIPLQDFTGGFNGWDRNVLESIGYKHFTAQGYSFQIELKYFAYLKKFRVKEFPICFQERKYGASKMNFYIILEAVVKVLQLKLCKKRA